MGYQQIDDVKDILVNEKGQLREGLRNIPTDSDRIEYEYDEDGNRANAWPLVVVDIDEDGTEDKRLLPALVLKEHGKLPRKMPVSASDFEAVNGKKLPPHCHIDNIKYVGDGSFAAGASPYKEPPSKQEQPSPPGTPMKKKTADEDLPESSGIPGDIDPDIAGEKDVRIKPEGRTEDGEDVLPEDLEDTPKEGRPEVASEDAEDGEPSDLMKGSGQLKAKRAIELIRTFEYEELVDVDFYTEDAREDGPRITVQDAWKSKKKNG